MEVTTAGLRPVTLAVYQTARHPAWAVPFSVTAPPVPEMTVAVTDVRAWSPLPLLVIVKLALSVPRPGYMGPPENDREPTLQDTVEPVWAWPVEEVAPPV